MAKLLEKQLEEKGVLILNLLFLVMAIFIVFWPGFWVLAKTFGGFVGLLTIVYLYYRYTGRKRLLAMIYPALGLLVGIWGAIVVLFRISTS